MGKDLTIPVEKEGMINIRVSAIIRKGNKLLMVQDKRDNTYYTIGGRVQFGETAEQAMEREVKEEIGCRLTIERLAFIEENFFYGDYEKLGYDKLVYETNWYFLLNTPDDLEKLLSETKGEESLRLAWIEIDTPEKYYPEFFRTELQKPLDGTKHIVTDQRK